VPSEVFFEKGHIGDYHVDSAEAHLISQFLELNSVQVRICPWSAPSPFHALLISQAEFDSLSHSVGLASTWSGLRRRYPTSEVVQFSRAAFSKDSTRAVVAYCHQYKPNCGGEEIIFYNLVDHKWLATRLILWWLAICDDIAAT
jgi:hypothetical protein